MSFELKTILQPDTVSSPQQKKLYRLIEKIEQQKLELAKWQQAKDEVLHYTRQHLIPVYQELHDILFNQLQQLWEHFSHGDFSKADVLLLDDKIQSLAQYLKSSQSLSSEQLNKVVHFFGETTSPDDIYLASRGLRSLAVRLKQHEENGVILAHYLNEHPAIDVVNHPALAMNPYHKLWQQSFSGSTGLFSFYLKQNNPCFVEAFFDSLKLFHIGLSWGGFESLILPVGTPYRTHSHLPSRGYLVRLHAGLEHVDDLKADLDEALAVAQCAIA